MVSKWFEHQKAALPAARPVCGQSASHSIVIPLDAILLQDSSVAKVGVTICHNRFVCCTLRVQQHFGFYEERFRYEAHLVQTDSEFVRTPLKPNAAVLPFGRLLSGAMQTVIPSVINGSRGCF